MPEVPLCSASADVLVERLQAEPVSWALAQTMAHGLGVLAQVVAHGLEKIEERQ